MIEGKTKSGFKFEIDERITNDWRLLEAIADADSEDASRQIKGTTVLVELLFGDQKDTLFEHIKKKNDGFVPVNVVNSEVIEVLNLIKKLKNS